MENEIILSAYHESARVVFAYINGYACDMIELPGTGAGNQSKLNAGSDIKTVQAVLSGSSAVLPPENLQHAVEVARKLMAIYCAGTCAKIYFQNNLAIPAELELDIAGQDLAIIEKIQTFLKKANVEDAADITRQTLISVFRKLRDAEVWKPIDTLAAKVLKEGNSLKRFYIEDTLMMAGMTIQRATTRSGFGLGLHEEDDEKPAPATEKAGDFDATDVTPLDIMVKDFLKKIKSDWKEDELKSAIAYLHNVYKKYGSN